MAEINLRSRRMERLFEWFAGLPRDEVPVPPRERLRRAWRRRSLAPLTRGADIRIRWPEGPYGLQITTYSTDCAYFRPGELVDVLASDDPALD